MSHVIRRARDADHGRITEIRNAVTENVLGEASRAAVDGDYPWFRDHPGVWLWEEDGVILGFSAADTRNGSIWALFVAPGHERRGIGRVLFEKACDVLRRTAIARRGSFPNLVRVRSASIGPPAGT